jgi:hypothetical protein
MMVEVHGVKSSPPSLFAGVPPGCIPSPLFFSTFMTGLCLSIRFANFRFYADDLQIYLSGDKKDSNAIISALNDDLASIYRWAAENGLLLNSRKSQAILISNSNVGMALPCLFLGAEQIPWCDVVTDLGVVIDGRLIFGRQVTRVWFQSLCYAVFLIFSIVLLFFLAFLLWIADVCFLQVLAFNSCARLLIFYDFRVLSFLFSN